CADDGKIYDDLCKAHAAGHRAANADVCDHPPDALLCGPTTCSAGTYCELAVNDVNGVILAAGCKPLPSACVPPLHCACVAGETCGSFCEAGPNGLTVSCGGAD